MQTRFSIHFLISRLVSLVAFVLLFVPAVSSADNSTYYLRDGVNCSTGCGGGSCSPYDEPTKACSDLDVILTRAEAQATSDITVIAYCTSGPCTFTDDDATYINWNNGYNMTVRPANTSDTDYDGVGNYATDHVKGDIIFDGGDTEDLIRSHSSGERLTFSKIVLQNFATAIQWGVGSVTLSDSDVKSCTDAGIEGLSSISQGDLTWTDGECSDNSNTASKGACFTTAGTASSGVTGIYFNNVTFNNNTQNSGGGAVRIGNASRAPDIEFTGCTFTNNESTGNSGGSVYLSGVGAGDPVFTNVTANNNTASASGGFLYVSGTTGNLTVTDIGADTNVATTGYGGTLYSSIAGISLSGDIDNSTANTGGGGMYLDAPSSGGTFAITSLNLDGNTALRGGGAFFGTGVGPNVSSFTWNGGTISNNTASSGGGGGIDTSVNFSNADPTFQNITLEKNTATTKGGGLNIISSNDADTITLTGISAYLNVAGSDGGAIHVGTGGGNVLITDVTIGEAVSANTVSDEWSLYGSGATNTYQMTPGEQVSAFIYADTGNPWQYRVARLGTDRTSLNDKEWIYASSTLYFRDSSGDPDTTGLTLYRGRGNIAGTLGYGNNAEGGGIKIARTSGNLSGTVASSTFTANWSDNQGGGLEFQGTDVTSTVTSSTFKWNTADTGAGLKFSAGAQGDVIESLFYENYTGGYYDWTGMSTIDYGGNTASCNARSSHLNSTLQRSILYGNISQGSADAKAAALGVLGCQQLTVSDSTIVDNEIIGTLAHGEQIYFYGYDYGYGVPTSSITNSIIYGDNSLADGEMIYDQGHTTTISYSAIPCETADCTTNINTFSNMQTSISDPFSARSSQTYTLSGTGACLDNASATANTTDYAGNGLYGIPDIGAYEYQPPYTMGTDDVPTTGSIRLYADGKYRMKTATSTSATASFSVTPVGGSWLATTTQYMDITIDTWETSGDQNKQWTATSTTGDFLTLATSTTYTIGDLVANSYYQFKLDSATSTDVTGATCDGNGICQADSSGNLTFTYTGGYSTHTFALELTTAPDSTAPTLTEITAIDTYTTDTTPSYTFSSDESGTINYSGSCSATTTSITANATTTVTFTTLSDGEYTDCALSVTDAASNTSATTTLSTFTVDTTDPSATLSTPTGNTTDRTPDFSWSGTDATSGIASYELFIDGSSAYSDTDTTYTPTSDLSCASHTYYVTATDNAGNAANSSGGTFTVQCGGGGTVVGLMGGSGGGALDSDGDGISDVQERQNGTDPYIHNDSQALPNIPEQPPTATTTSSSLPTNNSQLSTRHTFTTYLKKGSRGSEVSKLQQTLKALGFFTFTEITQYFGTITETAVKAFQKAHGIETTGTVGPITRATLNAVESTDEQTASSLSTINSQLSTRLFTYGLRYGMTDPMVKALQQTLNRDPDTRVAETGYGSKGFETDYFGEATLQAVQKFQSKHAITTPDDKAYGYVGPKTRAKLNALRE